MADSGSASVGEIDVSAINLLKGAVELDLNGKYDEATCFYQEGTKLLVEAHKAISEKCKQPEYRQQLQEHLDRPGAQDRKNFLSQEKEDAKKVTKIKIEENSTGHSYDKLFGHYLNQHVTSIEVDDPYLLTDFQINNFKMLCDLIVGKKIPVKTIIVNTKSKNSQKESFEKIKKSLDRNKIELIIKHYPTLHDREIRLSTGIVIGLGRGLDIFHNCDISSQEYYNLELRRCHDTTVTITHKNLTRDLTS
ncbi:MIT domain-containing protein 1 [Biomphalaria glabrata]|uniref:MIT domain-containing protein 1-like n=1 Tax=Biomphalaria glabrata TaxID=6526 RepID=A0A9U8ELD1_BIOGL|nr:MIT domain-containing protein 1-like [Biomphalaria glabrata]XP_055895387.1 MIT domain-containing protein 1-like [Biomphalaria glabrata]XP_055895388.1 MIT domain-containing protein 1-like [Biomphalaria glabrata]XP_055895390.1 MIT domain-containing protein 1-like [Biomphalaria glabrata]KAI8757395.1 MIT domain-containing protein 1-like [Biomphalaria glabrata]